MEEIVKAFGIDTRLIVIQILNFGLLLVALWYFLYTPVLKMLRDRQTTIEKGVKDAEASARALEAAGTKKEEIVGAAHKEAENIVLRARTVAEEKGSEILKNAESKSAKALEDAALKADELKHQAQKEHEAEVAKLAILAAERVLQERSKR